MDRRREILAKTSSNQVEQVITGASRTEGHNRRARLELRKALSLRLHVKIATGLEEDDVGSVDPQNLIQFLMRLSQIGQANRPEPAGAQERAGEPASDFRHLSHD
jgi:hypothetical protein